MFGHIIYLVVKTYSSNVCYFEHIVFFVGLNNLNICYFEYIVRYIFILYFMLIDRNVLFPGMNMVIYIAFLLLRTFDVLNISYL